jgi:hypothetical protein
LVWKKPFSILKLPPKRPLLLKHGPVQGRLISRPRALGTRR